MYWCGGSQSMSQQQQQSTAEGEGWFVEITDQPLDLLRLTGLVTNPAAGAISTFIGTTRNNFDNKAVLYLEYEAYVPMAVAKLKVLRLLATRIVCARVWACGCECSLQSSARPAGSGSSRANTNIFLPNGMLFLPQPVNCGGITQELCLAVQQQWQVTHVAMAHRTGTVKVCEASVIIAVSSPHRQAALQVRGRCGESAQCLQRHTSHLTQL